MKEISKEEKEYLIEKIPDVALTIIGKNKKADRKHYYVPDDARVMYFLRKYQKEAAR